MEKPKIEEIGKVLAESHVDRFLGTLRPLLLEHFQQGFKHGVETGKGNWIVSTESLKERK